MSKSFFLLLCLFLINSAFGQRLGSSERSFHSKIRPKEKNYSCGMTKDYLKYKIKIYSYWGHKDKSIVNAGFYRDKLFRVRVNKPRESNKASDSSKYDTPWGDILSDKELKEIFKKYTGELNWVEDSLIIEKDYTKSPIAGREIRAFKTRNGKKRMTVTDKGNAVIIYDVDAYKKVTELINSFPKK